MKKKKYNERGVYDDEFKIGICRQCHQKTFHSKLQSSIFSWRDTFRCIQCSHDIKTNWCGRLPKRFTSIKCYDASSINEKKPEYMQTSYNKDPSITIEHIPRNNINAQTLVDGREFFQECFNLFEQAKESIYLSFWHMNHQLFLIRRSNKFYEHHRFDNIIKKKAKEGVKIYIILWREVSRKFWLDNFSIEMKVYFENLHPNIQVLRHGHPSLPFPPFMKLWTHHQKFIVVDQQIAIVGGFDICLGRFDTNAHELVDTDYETWLGIDYYNPHYCRPSNLDVPYKDTVDRRIVPRMPWHDISVKISGDAAKDIALNFIQRWNHHSQDFQRLYIVRDVLLFSYLFISIFSDICAISLIYIAMFCILVWLLISSWYMNSSYDKLYYMRNNHSKNEFFLSSSGTCTVTMVRTLAVWSGGVVNDESLYYAHMKAISEAQSFIYIENQYFSTSLAGGGVQNQLGNQLLIKLRNKIKNKEKFVVIILIPLPEETGEGALTIIKWLQRSIKQCPSSLITQLEKEFPNVDLSEYIGFFGLRTHSLLYGKAVTEKIYIHSKTMIVDDEVVIISSANMNDRSLLHSRDSELGCIIQDNETIAIKTEHQGVVKRRKFAYNLRTKLWREHLGIPNTICIDDVNSKKVFNDIWLRTAQENTDIYEKVFPSIPQNTYRTFKKFCKFGGETMPYQAKDDINLLKRVKGHLCFHPTSFLLNTHVETTLAKYVIGEVSAQ